MKKGSIFGNDKHGTIKVWPSSFSTYGADADCEVVYSPRNCVCTFISKTDKIHSTVVLELNSVIAYKFSNLRSVRISEGNAVKEGDVVGLPDKFIHFEYLISKQDEAYCSHPVRIYKKIYDKEDPMKSGVIDNE